MIYARNILFCDREKKVSARVKHMGLKCCTNCTNALYFNGFSKYLLYQMHHLYCPTLTEKLYQ